MRPPSLFVVGLAALCASPAAIGAGTGTVSVEAAVLRTAVLLVVGWGLEVLLRPAAVRLIGGPPAPRDAVVAGTEVPAQEGTTVPEVA